MSNEVTNLTDLAEFLKTLEYDPFLTRRTFFQYKTKGNKFNMREAEYCIGGWAKRLQKDTSSFTIVEAVKKLAPTVLWEEIDKLCFRPHSDKFDGWDATPHQAARAVELLRDTGKCDWERAMKEAQEA